MNQIISNRTKHILYLFYVVLAFVAVLMFAGVLQKFERDPLSVSALSPPDVVEIASGESFTFWREVCTSRDLLVHVHREFHHLSTGQKYMLTSAEYIAHAESGCYETQFAARLPSRVPPGLYEYRPILTYDVNPALTITKRAPFVRIEVTQ